MWPDWAILENSRQKLSCKRIPNIYECLAIFKQISFSVKTCFGYFLATVENIFGYFWATVGNNLATFWQLLETVWLLYGNCWKQFGYFLATVGNNLATFCQLLETIRLLFGNCWKQFGYFSFHLVTLSQWIHHCIPSCGPGFESHAPMYAFTCTLVLYLSLCWEKDENDEQKRGQVWPKKKVCLYLYWSVSGFLSLSVLRCVSFSFYRTRCFMLSYLYTIIWMQLFSCWSCLSFYVYL